VVRHAASDLRVTRVSAGRGQVIAELRKGSRVAFLTLDAAAQDGYYLAPPSEGLGNLIAAVEIEGRPHALMQAGGNLAMIGLPENAWHEPQTLSLVSSATADAAIYSPDAWKGRPTVAVARDDRIDEFYTDEPHSPETLLQANGPVHALAYSDNGEMLAYLEETTPGQQALQVHRFFSVDQVNTLVAEGELRLPEAPFQPGGEDVLLQTRANPPRFAVHDTRSGARRLSIDDARTAAWGPAGETILIVAPDRGGRDQLWRLTPQRPGARTQLTFLEQGIAPAIGVDTDTRMAFAPLHGGNGIAAVRLP
jgi:hypothetical protein